MIYVSTEPRKSNDCTKVGPSPIEVIEKLAKLESDVRVVYFRNFIVVSLRIYLKIYINLSRNFVALLKLKQVPRYIQL